MCVLSLALAGGSRESKVNEVVRDVKVLQNNFIIFKNDNYESISQLNWFAIKVAIQPLIKFPPNLFMLSIIKISCYFIVDTRERRSVMKLLFSFELNF